MPIEYDLPLFSYIEEKVPVCPEGYEESVGKLVWITNTINDIRPYKAICRMCGEEFDFDGAIKHQRSECMLNYNKKYK
jgi:hypothetical protein